MAANQILSTLVQFKELIVFIILTIVLSDVAEAGYCYSRYSSTYCGGYVYKYCCHSHNSVYCCDYDTYYGRGSPIAAIAGGIFSLCLFICIFILIICCCKSTCPLYRRRYRGQVIGPGRTQVVTGGATTVAVTSHSGYAYPQQQTGYNNYGYAPQQGYVYSAAQPMPPPYPGQYPAPTAPAPRYPRPPRSPRGAPPGPGPTPVNINRGPVYPPPNASY